MKLIHTFYSFTRSERVILSKLTMILITLFTGVCLISASILPDKPSPSRKSFTPPHQEIEITGQVTDASTGEALHGVNIVVEGSSIGEITDNEGNYSITILGESSVLVFSYVGYATESVTVGNQRIINLALTPEAQEIDEVVAIGYGTIRKSDLTGAVSSVRQEDIEKVNPDNVLTALQGRAPGVYISQNTGAPGVEPTIRIRGAGSINNHSPIYVIDGMIMDISDIRDESSTINFLNPADIASIEVLKDASATAIYGSRGANGVILITTHKGFDSSPKVSFNAQLGLSRMRNLPDKLRADDYIEYLRNYYGNGYATSQPDTLPEMEDNITLYNDGYDTDWYAEILKDRPALSQNYNLSVKGGTRDARYLASFGYYNEEGILVANSDYDRYSLRINSDFNLGKYIRLGENLSISQMNRIGMQGTNDGIFRSLMWANPLYPVLKQFDITDPDHPLYADPDDFMYAEPGDPDYDYYKYSPGAEPLSALSYFRNVQNHRLSIFGNVFAEASLLKDFTFRSSLGLNLSNSKIHDFEPAYFVTEDNFNTSGRVYRNLYWTDGWLWENTLTYHKSLQNHTITALVGYTSEYNKYEYLYATKIGTPSNEPEMQTLNAATSMTQLDGSHNILTMVSMLGRISYSFKDRYLLTASIRRDGSSKFGPEYKWGVFPSAAIAWKISNEPFFEELRSKILPNLKLRAGWGQIGNSSMNENNSNAYVSQYATGPEFRALFGNDQPHSGYSFETIGIPNLTWETIEQINVGLDIGMFRNALILNADYYIRTTQDMLVRVEVPSYAGYGLDNEPWSNAGSVENKGFEFIITYKGNAGRLTYDISANVSSYKNTVLSTNQDNTDLRVFSNPAITRVGYPIASFYGFATDGIFQTEDEVQAYVDEAGNPIQPNAVPGDFRFRDLNGDGEITAGVVWDTTGISGDQTIIGNGHPDLIFGFSLNLGYRGFDLMTFWHGTLGNELWNTQRAIIESNRESYLASWSGEGTSNTFPRITSNDNNRNFRDSDFFVEDGSYLRMKHIQIGYALPESLVRKLHISSCRIYVGGDDLITITNYSGIDPEVGLGDPQWSGIDGRMYYDGAIYPRSRRITIGIQIEF